MACISERNRMEDKYTTARNAYDVAQGKRDLALAADAAMVVACGVAIWTGGGGGFTAAACAAAVAALAYAISEYETAVDLAENAADSYQQAQSHYSQCMAKCRSGGS